MTGTGPSQSDVAIAYDALVDDGIQPSISAIRTHLGNTGSLETIADHVRSLTSARWQEPGPALPDPILKSLIAGAENYWVDLAQAADTQIEANNVQYKAQLEARREELDEARSESASLRDTLLELKTRNAQLETELSESVTKQKTTQQQLDETRILFDETSAQLDQTRTQLNSTKAELLTVTQERDEANHLLTETQQSNNELQNQFQTQQLERKNIELVRDRAAQAMSLKLDDVREALNTTSQSVESLEADKIRGEQERESLASQVTRLESTVAAKQNQITELQNAFRTLRSKNSALNAQLEESISMASEAEMRRQALVKSLNADFAVVLGNTRAIEQDTQDKPSLLKR